MSLEKVLPASRYEETHLVSSNGQIFRKTHIGKYGTRRGRWLKPQHDRNGYIHVLIGAPRVTKKLHRIIAETFIPNPDNLPVINHIDGVRDNNSIDNLEWCTQSHNVKHSFITGAHIPKKGTEQWRAKLNQVKVNEIRVMLNDGVPQYTIAEQFSVNQSVISRIKNNKAWRHLNVT